MKTLIRKIYNSGTSFRRREEAIVPPELSKAVRFPYGAFRFSVKTVLGASYEIEASTNLKVWQVIDSDIAQAEEFEYVDTDAPNYSFRFYRMRAGASLSTAVLGYATMTLPPGYSMIANPFDTRMNDVANLFKDMPDGTKLNKFDSQSYQLKENGVKDGRWANPHEKLSPGEGGILFNPASDYRPLSFVGNVLEGQLSLPIPGGFSVRSSMVPLPGRLDTDLDFPIAEGDSIHLYDRDRQKYVVYPYDPKQWESNPPLVNVGESFWVAKTSPGNWSRTVSLPA